MEVVKIIENRDRKMCFNSACCHCCGFTSFIGVIFFGITATMVFRQNTVFLTHKAGMSLHDITDDAVNKKGMAMVYTACVSANGAANLINKLSSYPRLNPYF